jgi:PleD family two-component response regulator
MGRKKILVVDDSKVASMTAQLILRREKRFDVIEASDGIEAVKKATEELPDLILMDVMMPNMDGFEACRELRSLESTKDIPIIMVTTRSEADNVEMGFESGCNDYIFKPVEGIELLTKVRKLIDQ